MQIADFLRYIATNEHSRRLFHYVNVMFAMFVLQTSLLLHLIKIFIEIEIIINIYNMIVKKERRFKLYQSTITSRLINHLSVWLIWPGSSFWKVNFDRILFIGGWTFEGDVVLIRHLSDSDFAGLLAYNRLTRALERHWLTIQEEFFFGLPRLFDQINLV